MLDPKESMIQAVYNVKSIDILSVVSGLLTVFVFINDNAYWGYVMAAIPMFICAGAVLRDQAKSEKMLGFDVTA
ncbi:hypothetical protein [Pantoea sp. Cy-639]|uniref:hypothetical protein n=1 Tax=Pantoea sp. Cy-639 TaxID=2608360 RepID=UPI001423F521|nr:hypothetical protein [Pantoea sp. Cy-639]NIF15663.1 hypothetical protein [Pantoea sp. Cy-639]